MPSLTFKDSYICYRNKLTIAEAKWMKEQKHEKYKNVSNFNLSSNANEEEEAFKAIKSQKLNYCDVTEEDPPRAQIDVSEILCKAATCMTKRDWIGALVHFTEALTLCDDSQKYNVLIKRSDCFDRLQEYDKALGDAEMAIQFIDKNKSIVPYHRCVKFLINLGEIERAKEFLRRHREIFNVTAQVASKFESEMQKLNNFLDDIQENSKDSKKCLEIISNALSIAPHSIEFLVQKIKHLVISGDLESAKNVEQLVIKRCGKIVKVAEAFQQYYKGTIESINFDAIYNTLKLEMFKDLKANVEEIKKNFAKATSHIKEKKYNDAVYFLHEIIESDCVNKNVFQKAHEMLFDCYSNMRNQEDNTIKYATKIIEVKKNNARYLWARAKAYATIKDYNKVKKDLDEILKKTISDETRLQAEDLLSDVQRKLDMEQRKKYEHEQREKARQEAQEKAKQEEERLKKESAKQTKNMTQAENLNEKANVQYKAGHFSNALLHYTEAIKLAPRVGKYYTNRSACYMAMGDYENALPDAIKAVDIDPSSWKGYSRAINCFLIIGNIAQAKLFIEKMQNNIAVIDSIKFNEIPKVEKLEGCHQQIIKLMFEKNYDDCLKQLDSALKIAPECKKYKFLRAECLVMLGRFEEARNLIASYRNEPHMRFLLGLNAFLCDEFSVAIQHFKDTLRLDPEFREAVRYKSIATKLEQFNNELQMYLNSGNYTGALRIYTSIIDCDQENEKVKLRALVGRSELNFKLLKYQQAFEDASLALRKDISDQSDELFMKALLIRAQVHIHNQEYDYAIIDCDELLRLSKNSFHKNEAERFKTDAKYKSAHQSATNHFDVLQVPRNSPFAVIKEAFKNLSKKFHSDKHPNATPLEKKKLEKKFQEIRTAYEVLKIQLEC